MIALIIRKSVPSHRTEPSVNGVLIVAESLQCTLHVNSDDVDFL
jgi:hypothetical protein